MFKIDIDKYTGIDGKILKAIGVSIHKMHNQQQNGEAPHCHNLDVTTIFHSWLTAIDVDVKAPYEANLRKLIETVFLINL